ncbi:MAG: DNA/RNA non-specific endonuclease [Clostridia bacterium]|nr:DNA/RNA non-specific endonuclease [Clostridia bacterium]
MKKLIAIILVILTNITIFSACSSHASHAFKWIQTDEGHYKEYYCNCATEDDFELHYDNNGDNLCDVCNFQLLKDSEQENTNSSTDSSVDSSTPDNPSDDNNQDILEYEIPALTTGNFNIADIPEYTDSIVYIVNDNKPYFYSNQYVTESYEYYSELDSLGRCGVAVACLGKDLMPTEDRGSISSVTPTGWVSGNTIYERSHLLGFQLTGENANRQNLITGTYLLNGAMQVYEEELASYIKSTNKHVLYRVTPIFEGNNLLASGVLMEAYSIEDNGASICLNIFIYNVQTDYDINYADGTYEQSPETIVYAFVINKSNKKIHNWGCRNINDMSDSNKIFSNDPIEDLLSQGYIKAGCCW